jgi:mono/diheme cytochrome c family protein
MSGWAKLNWVLLVVVTGVLALSWGLETDPTQRNIDVLPGMVTPVAYESFTANPVLPGGMTMQPPPRGTIPREQLPLRYEATPEDALRAGEDLSNPFSADDPAAVARGEFVFMNYCQVCHGAGGEGDGPVAKRGFPTPASLLAPNAREIADGRVFHIITYGQGNMPAHASQVGRDDRWKATLWVRQLQQDAGPVIEGGLPAEKLLAEVEQVDMEESRVGEEVGDES